MSTQYIQFALNPEEEIAVATLLEEARVQRFRHGLYKQRQNYNAFVGGDGHGDTELSSGTRRRIASALRQASLVLGMGQKSSIGRLGSGAAVGAIIVGFATPALAQYQAGGATANDSLSTSVGSGAVAGQAGIQTIDTNGDGIPDLTLNEDSAFGTGASATGGFATAIGNGVSAQGLYATAIGSDSIATGNGAIALGRTNTVDSFGVGAVMVQQGVLNRVTGTGNQILGNGATDVTAVGIGIGTNNTVDGAGVAVGSGNLVNNTGSSGFAFGNANAPTGAYSIGIGMGNTASATSAIAIGTVSVASGNTAIAMGRQSAASGQTSIAMGNVATANQINAIAIGHSTQATAAGAIAMGGGNNSASTNLDATAARAAAANAIAIGTNTTALLANAVALGNSSDATGVSSIAIGAGSTASGTQSIAIGTGNIVSGNNSGAIGDPNTVTGNESYALGNNNTVNANNAFAIGNNITIAAGRDGSVGIGHSSTVAAPNTGAFTLNGGTAAATAPTAVVSVGAAGAERQITNVAAGVVSATSSDAVNGSQLFTVATAANNLGDSLETVTGGGLVMNANGTIATAPSISAAGGTHTSITGAIQALNTANTTTNTGLAVALGGGAGVAANGTVTAPSYVVGGTTYNDVGSALGALSSSTLVQQTGGSPGAGEITIGAATGGTSLSVAGTSGSRTVTGVRGGSLAASSTEAVNGAQVNTLASSIATNTGGGSTFDPLTGTVTAPSFTVAGGTQTNTGAAFDALDDANTLSNTGISSAIGGGMAIAANGAVTAPVLAVNGTNYSNVADALAAAGAGFNFTTAASGTGTMSGTSVAGIGAGETLTVTAGNNLVGTQTGNGVELGLNPVLTGITSLAVTGGPTISATGIAMNGVGITGMAAGAVNATSTDAVTGAQLFAIENAAAGSTDALGASVAANLGGTATYDPATDTVNGLSINAAGSSYTTVTGAIEALDAANSTSNTGLASALGGGAVVAPDGTVTAPNYAVQGSTYNNVGSALGAIDSSLTNVLNGTAGLVQQAGGSPGAGQITVGATTGGTSVSFAGTSGSRVLTSVAAGAITATSVDAVNGSQVFANNSQIAAFLGGGASVDPLTGALTAPSYTVGGTNLGDVGAAIVALQTGAPVQYSTAGAPTTPNGLVPSQNMTLVGAAAGPVTLSNVGPASLAPTSTDAVNGSQINTLAASIAANTGGGSTFNPVTGTLTAPTINAAGATFGNTTAAIEALNTGNNTANTGIASAIGGGMAIAPDGTVTNPTFSVNGSTYANVADALNAAGGGFNLTTAATGSGVANGTSVAAIGAGETQTITAGDNIVTTQVGNEVQVALNSNLTGISSISVVGGPVINGSGINMGGDTITNLGAGSTAAGSTDAVNGGQINTGLSSVASGLGGGSTYDPVTGVVTNPTYNVAGGTQNNVGSALGALDTAVANIANGTSGLVQQTGGAPGSGVITVGANTGGTVVNMAGTAGNRTVTGVAAGAVSATSSDAVNGAQLFAVQNTANGALQRSGGTMTGAVNMGGNAITNVAAPTNAGDATNKAYVDGVAAAAAATTTNLGSTAAAYFGGGSAYNPATGQVSAPTYTVGGQNYGDVGSALAATNALAVQYVPSASGAPTNAVRLGNGTVPVSMTNLAAGAVTATSTDGVNGSQLYTVQQTANGALQRTGGAMSGSIAMGGNRITGLGAPVDATDAATRGYVDGLQAQNVNQFNLMTAGLNSAFRGIEKNSQGVALAMAMGGGFLSDDKDFSLWGAWGNFNGYNALAAQTYIRLTDDAFINAGVSFGMEEKLVGTRVGFGIQF